MQHTRAYRDRSGNGQPSAKSWDVDINDLTSVARCLRHARNDIVDTGNAAMTHLSGHIRNIQGKVGLLDACGRQLNVTRRVQCLQDRQGIKLAAPIDTEDRIGSEVGAGIDLHIQDDRWHDFFWLSLLANLGLDVPKSDVNTKYYDS